MSTIITPSEEQINIVVNDEKISINVESGDVIVNVTENIVEVSTVNGGYPLPTTVYSVFGRTGNIIAVDGDYDLGELGDVTLVSSINGDVLTYDGTKWINKAVTGTGTVTSVNMSVPVGLQVSGNPITVAGTLAVNFASGYSLPTTAKQITWDAAYNDSIVSASVSGTTTKTLTLNQQDGGTITASWTDIDTNLVTSVNGYVGTVVLTTTDIAEGTRLYYTETRVSNNVDVAANTAARHSAVTIGTANGLSLASQVLSLALASASTTGALSSTDWVKFNTAYNDSIVSANVSGTTTKTLTLTQQDAGTITASWSDLAASGTVTSVGLSSATNGVTIGSSPITTSGTITLDIATATTSQNGLLSSTDWSTFNAKQNAITLTTTGTSGASTLVGATLNIPNYGSALTGYVPYTGATTAIDLNAKTVVNISHLGINTTSVPTILIRAVGDNNSSSRIAMRGYSSDANSSSIRVTKFRGTVGAPQAPQSGDSLGKFELAGYGTTSSDGYPQASFEGLATESWGATARGTKVVIKVTPNTTITQAVALTINQDKSAVFENSITATSLIKTGGTSSQFLKADGTVDSSAYIALTGLSATAPLSYNNTTGGFTISQAGVSGNGYLSSTDWNTFNNKQASGSYITALSGEATASGPGSAAVTLSTSAVTGKLLTGVNITGGSISATDSILVAFGKVQNQINGVLGGAIYQSVWNASTNSPTLTSGTGTKGYYYIVSVAGSTNLDGITDWKVGDWAIFNGTTWNKVDNSDAVSSVNGYTGAVSLTTSDITEGSRLYYTEGRVSANTDVAANTAARHAAVTIGTANGLSLSTQALSLALASTSATGALSSTDWNTFNLKQAALSGTGFVKISGSTISYDNSTYYLASNPTAYISLLALSSSATGLTYTNTTGVFSFTAGYSIPTNASQTQWDTAYSNRISTLNGLTAATQNFSTGMSGTDFNISSTTATHTFNIPSASATARGLLSSADWTTFNNKQNALTNPVTGTGTTNYLPKFTGASTIGNSNLINDASGNLGLGVTPSAWATFKAFELPNISFIASAGEYIQMIANGFYNGTNYTYKTSNVATMYAQAVGQHQWFNAPTGTANDTFTFTQAMTLDASGRLGIGIATPLSILHIEKASQDNILAVIGQSGYEGALFLSSAGSGKDANIVVGNNRNLEFHTSSSATPVVDGTLRMTLTASGNLGLGTPTPSVNLHIKSTTGNVASLVETPSGSFAQYQLKGGATDVWLIGTQDNYVSNALVFRNVSDRMVITTGGNVGIGITDPGYKLDVNGTARVSGVLRLSAAESNTVYLTSFMWTPGTYTGFRQGTDQSFNIDTYNSGTYVNALKISQAGTAIFASSVTATSFFESSDSRLKTLIQDNYQTKGIASITPKLYTKNGKVELGYYAQDFVGILDSAVSKGSDDMLSLSYREVHTAKIYALEQEIKELKAKMN
jgi:hypothetical protein